MKKILTPYKFITVFLFIILFFTSLFATNFSIYSISTEPHFKWTLNTDSKSSDSCARPLDTCVCNQILLVHAIWKEMGMRVPFDSFAYNYFGQHDWLSTPENVQWACSTSFSNGSGEDAKGKNISWKSGAYWNSTSIQNLEFLQNELDLTVPCKIAKQCHFSDSQNFLSNNNLQQLFIDSIKWKTLLMQFLNQYPVRKYRMWAKCAPNEALRNVIYEYIVWRNTGENQQKQDLKRVRFIKAFSGFILQNNAPIGSEEIDYVFGRMLFFLKPNSFEMQPTLGMDTAVKNFIESISEVRAQLNYAPLQFSPGSHCLHSNNWLLTNANENRDIEQFYNSTLYPKHNNNAGLRFIHDRYKMPDLFAHIEDKIGYLCKFELYYDLPNKWYNINRIMYVDSIESLYVDTLLGEAYFHIWVQQDVAKKYWNTTSNLNKYYLADGFTESPIYCIARIHMICRVRMVRK